MGGFVDDVKLTGGASGKGTGYAQTDDFNLGIDLTNPWWVTSPKSPGVGYSFNSLLTSKNISIAVAGAVIIYSLRRK
jgi:hypothetical protein